MQSPAYRLVAETAFHNWWLIAANLFSNVLSAVLEGSTLGIIYVAITCLTEADKQLPGEDGSELIRNLSTIVPLLPEQMFLVLICVALILQIGLSLSNYANQVSAASLSAKAQPYVTSKVFERIMIFSYGCVSRYKVGDLVLFANDAAIAVDRQIEYANKILLSLSFALVYLAIIVRLSPLLAIAASALTLLVGFVQYKLIPRLRKVVRSVTATQVESAKHITENIQALSLVHSFGTQRQTIKIISRLLNKTQKQLEKRARILYIPELILDTLPMIALSVLAASAVLLQGERGAILPLLLTFLLALQRLSARLKSLASAVTQFVDNSARMSRLETILDERDKVFEHSGVEPFVGLQSDIEFRSVCLSYSNDDVCALKDLSFNIPRNKVTALVGGSGAGKSSIVNLLIGLYQPQVGKVIINGHPLADYCLSDWRQKIGVVSQDTFVFNDSVLENLRYGRSEASQSEVINAAKLAQAHDFIMALPSGYDTVVGERGHRLSGGQRQRLALARALVKQPEILILDEATSALDSESEKLIQQALKQFKEERTVIVVAHRLSTVAEADQILVLEAGEVIERGTHRSLLQKRESRYAHYWRLQSNAVSV